jgi:hypothetical protein
MRISSTGNASGILGTLPIPSDWPEQSVTIVGQKKTANVRSVAFKRLTKDIRQMIIKVNRLSPGDSAEATILVRVEKRNILPPERPETLEIASTIPNNIQTYLRPSPYIESNDPKIKSVAEEIVDDQGLSDWEIVERIYDWVRDHVEYRFDEQIHSSLDALANRNGDCEELSSLFIAICRARGIPARAVWIPEHTYPEFFLVDRDGVGHWFPCQAAGDRQFGAMSEKRPILQKGDRFRLPGSPNELRYVQPTLVAKDAAAGLSLQWVSREVSDEDATSFAPIKNN